MCDFSDTSAGAMMPHATGGTVVLLPSRKFDADELLQLVEAEAVKQVVIVGDAFARPIADALDAAVRAGRPYDTSSLLRMTSSGVMWTQEVKNRLLDHVPAVMLVDAMGSTEGAMATSVTTRGSLAPTAKFALNPTTKVFADDGTQGVPGDGRTGMGANGGLTPYGYYKDPEKSARTFRVIDGVRYSFPGDLATFDENGQMVLLGRGSQVINTAGEKVFPEEVEEAVKRVEGVVDCLVVGLPDEKFGQAVVAVASLRDGAELDESTVIASVKSQLSGYKAPKRVVFVAEVPRAPNGKADYPGAKALAEAATR
ncbi:MAG: AMP-binding enzyme [Ilumatobacteraceae bacterium]